MKKTVLLAVMAAVMVGQAAAQEMDPKGQKELTGLSRRIDRSAAAGDAGRVAARIADEWKATTFKFDAADTPRAITAQDVQDLRAKGLGFGEISILLALTAKQPDSTTAKSLNDVLAMRQAAQGWGKIARALGYKNLGSVVRSVRASERGLTRAEKPEPAGRAEKPEKPQKVETRGKQ